MAESWEARAADLLDRQSGGCGPAVAAPGAVSTKYATPNAGAAAWCAYLCLERLPALPRAVWQQLVVMPSVLFRLSTPSSLCR